MTEKRTTIIVAPDSFKGSLTALQVAEAIAKGIRRVLFSANIISVPMADGGEGTVQAFMQTSGGSLQSCNVLGPLCKPRVAEYGILGNRSTVVIEMAAASGLPLIPKHQRDPFRTTTFGTGQLIKDALDRGYRDFIIGIGGSATVDGGAGMAQALGVQFYDEQDCLISDPMHNASIGHCHRINLHQLHPALPQSRFTAACDVDNPLLGPRGAVYTYAVQKGAKTRQLPILEHNLQHFFGLVENTCQTKVRHLPGSGAAGGLGAGLRAFLHAGMRSGIDLLLETVHFRAFCQEADLIITGEGRIDHQTHQGKVISGLLDRARQFEVPIIAIAGQIVGHPQELHLDGISGMYAIGKAGGPFSTEDSPRRIEDRIAAVLRKHLPPH